MGFDEAAVREIIARVNRIPVWPLSGLALVVIGMGYFFTFYDISDIGFAMPAIDAQFHLGSSLSLFIALSVGLIGYGVGSYVIGTLADLHGRYRAMILTMALTAIGSFGDALSVNVPMLAVFRFITGLGLGADLNLVSSYLAEFAPPSQRGRLSVLTFLVGILGQAITPFVALYLVPAFYYGWRYLFVIGGVIAIIALVLRFELPESPRWLAARAHRIGQARRVLEMLEANAIRKVGKLPEPRPDLVVMEEPRFPTLYLFRKPYVYRLLMLIAIWFPWYIGNLVPGRFSYTPDDRRVSHSVLNPLSSDRRGRISDRRHHNVAFDRQIREEVSDIRQHGCVVRRTHTFRPEARFHGDAGVILSFDCARHVPAGRLHLHGGELPD